MTNSTFKQTTTALLAAAMLFSSCCAVTPRASASQWETKTESSIRYSSKKTPTHKKPTTPPKPAPKPAPAPSTPKPGNNGYDSKFDYSAALKNPNLSQAQRDNYEAQRQAKINGDYGGVEPPLQGSSSTYTETHDSQGHQTSTPVPKTPQTEFAKNEVNKKLSNLTPEEAAKVKAAMDSGFAGKTISKDDPAVALLLKAMGMTKSQDNIDQAMSVLNNAYTTGTSGRGSSSVDMDGNNIYREGGKAYKVIGSGSNKKIICLEDMDNTHPDAVNLSDADLAAIIDIKTAFSKAKTPAEKAKLHDQAEAIRAKYDYTGGIDGGFYSPSDNTPFNSSNNGGDSSKTNPSTNPSTPSTPTPAPNVYSITASDGPHGTVTPAGVTKVTQGYDKAYHITASKGYEVAAVIVDGKNIGSKTYYLFTNVNENHSISATFKSAMSYNEDASTFNLIGLKNGQIKSGYGIGANVKISSEHADVSVVARNSATKHSITLQEINGMFVYPVNHKEGTGERLDYTPVSCKNGTYSVEFTVTCTNKDDPSDKIVKTTTKHFKINGSMYDDTRPGDHF